ncbi:unnamed protein product [Oikopleura dioica]|uniref:NR LBD domain-containing protein n=1 Tax=Oikopleura dioica TaxID=34765 RepID=E4YPX9_OIKDI|nr:unnamed protein product [Oikopleura dioica]
MLIFRRFSWSCAAKIRSRPSTPEGSILYDLLTTGASKHQDINSASRASFKNILDESINYLIRKCTFLKIPLPEQLSLIRRDWLCVFLIKCALSGLSPSLALNEQNEREIYEEFRNMTEFVQNSRANENELTDIISAVVFNERSLQLSRLTQEHQLQLGNILLCVSEARRMDSQLLSSALFRDVELPIRQTIKFLQRMASKNY